MVIPHAHGIIDINVNELSWFFATNKTIRPNGSNVVLENNYITAASMASAAMALTLQGKALRVIHEKELWLSVSP